MTSLKILFSSSIILSLLSLYSCEKKAVEINLSEISKCYFNNPHDSANLMQQLNNTSWKLISKYSFWTNQTINMKPRNIVLNITNGYFYISENGVQTSYSIFALESIQEGNISYFKILDTSNSLYMDGKIFICNDELVFHNSYIDGEDCLFKKL